MKTALLMLILICAAFTARAQQQTQAVELGPELYSSLPIAGGYGWVAYGHIYPAGTFTAGPGKKLPRGACANPEGVAPIGSYAIYGQGGSQVEHIARYRLSFGWPANTARSYLFEGTVRVAADEGGAHDALLFAAARLFGGQITQGGGILVYTPRSNACFGGKVQLFFEP